MYIDPINNNNLHFKSRSKEIRLADDIARIVNRKYPRISISLIDDFENISKFPNLYSRIKNKILQLRDLIDYYLIKAETPNAKCKIFTDTIKSKKYGNCHEASTLAYIAAQVNGLETARIAQVMHPDGSSYDHGFIIVNKNGRKPYIIDAWLGFADYLPNAIKRWQNEYARHFNFKKHPDKRMIIDQYEGSNSRWMEFINISELKDMYSDLIIKRNVKALKKEKTLWGKIKRIFSSKLSKKNRK